MNATEMTVGFFGKLPARGDFLRAGLSRGFTDRWDAWLQQVLPAARALLGEDWSTIWQDAPAWRFAVPAGGLFPRPVLGVLLPSLDRAGRYFPLTIAAEGAEAGDAFLDQAEAIGRAAIGLEVEPDHLLAQLNALAPPKPSAPDTPPAACARWWQGTSPQGGLALDGLPEAALLVGMLTTRTGM